MLQTFAQTSYSYTTSSSSSVSAVPTLIFVVIVLALSAFEIVAMWKVFVKASKPGWAAIVPVYNLWVLFELTGLPNWLAILSVVPFVTIVPAIVSLVAYYRLAKMFGKSDTFAVCNVLFSAVTLPILGFGSATFQGASAGLTPQAMHSDPTNPGQHTSVPTPPPSVPEPPKDQTPPSTTPIV